MIVVPNERCGTVDEIRRSATPGSLFLLAELDGEIAGSGIAGRSDLAGQGFVAPRVVPRRPAARRRAPRCSARWRAHVQRLGFDEAGSLTEDKGSFDFARALRLPRGRSRHRAGPRRLGDEQPPAVPQGSGSSPWPNGRISSSVSTASSRPRRSRISRSTGRSRSRSRTGSGSGSPGRRAPSSRSPATRSSGGGPLRDDDHPDRAENSLTAVRRDWRRRGVASTLKRAVLAWAAQNGLREIYTWTQRGNEGMRAVNESLGYVTRAVEHPRPRPASAPGMTRLPATTVYYGLEFFLRWPTWVVMAVYLVNELHLSPLQLVLMGTAMEAAVFLFEIPTGVVADTYSRRLSLIIGYLGMGAAWALVAVFSDPWAVIALWAFWGISYTFTSGAYEAWITDEVGRENIGSLFLRGRRARVLRRGGGPRRAGRPRRLVVARGSDRGRRHHDRSAGSPASWSCPRRAFAGGRAPSALPRSASCARRRCLGRGSRGPLRSSSC